MFKPDVYVIGVPSSHMIENDKKSNWLTVLANFGWILLFALGVIFQRLLGMDPKSGNTVILMMVLFAIGGVGYYVLYIAVQRPYFKFVTKKTKKGLLQAIAAAALGEIALLILYVVKFR